MRRRKGANISAHKLSAYTVGRTWRYLRAFGVWATLTKLVAVARTSSRSGQRVNDYQLWITQNEPTASELVAQRRHIFKKQPLVSLIVPVYNPAPSYLREMVKSIQNQTYSQWQLCVAEASKLTVEQRQFWGELEQDGRIVITYLPKNLGITGNTEVAVKQATGEYLVFLDHDDTLAPNALFEVVDAINQTAADFLYTDEDKQFGLQRHSPHFKPDWSPDLLRSYNYVTHLLVLKRSLFDMVGGLCPGYDGAQDYDLILRASEQAKKIIHIPKVLYHWREHEDSTAFSATAKPYVVTATTAALQSHLKRIGVKAEVTPGPFLGASRVRYQLSSQPLVSIIIPNRNSAKVLKRCLDSILDQSTYQSIEIIIIENGSTEADVLSYYQTLEQNPKVSILRWKGPFNYSAINNLGATKSRGEVLLFLNNDTEVISPGWIEEMLGFAQRPDVGAVGAKLYYPNQTIQHAGVILGLHGVAGHAHRQLPKDDAGYFGRLLVPGNVSAVTGACLMIRKIVFDQVGGFDETLAIDLNDIDLCLKAKAAGFSTVWTPYAELYHFEGHTRGYSQTNQFQTETAYFKQKWHDQFTAGDPYYNPNLSLESDNFMVKISQ